MAYIKGDRATMLACRLFEFLRLEVKYDSQMMDLVVASKMIREELSSKEEDLRVWLSYMDSE